MAQRIESILGRLVPSDEGDTDPIPFRALARELFAVERFFESNGFLSAAKEVAHVERTLEALPLQTRRSPRFHRSTLPISRSGR